MGRRTSHKDEAAITALEALYAELPVIHCQGGCALACGEIPLTDLEARRLQVTTHRKPRTIPIVEAGRTRDRCVYLTPADRCGAYAVRPLICRAFGVVKMLSCFRGCVPDRWLTDREFLRIAQAIEHLGGGRQLVTTPEGLALHPSGSFTQIPITGGRSEAHVQADAERTRALRALHGGRVLAAITKRESSDE